jgi:uncharacterized membrane protein YsdA (DUF1294 family)
VWVYLLVVSVVTFGFYGFDKYRAIQGGRRIPEMMLHVLTLAGGTLGALAGMYMFRHKTKKLKFRVVFMLIVTLQAAILVFYLFKYKQ